MNRGRRLKTLIAVRLGDILYDEHRRLVLLCRSCNGHYITFETYEQHLDNCAGIKHIITPTDQLSYDETKRETRLLKGCQELHVYDIGAVQNVIREEYDWQAELEDPRWYTDEQNQQPQITTKPKENGTKTYKRPLQMPEKVQKLPQTKGNQAKPPATSQPVCPTLSGTQQKRPRHSISSTTTSKTKRTSNVIVVPNLKEDLQRLVESSKVKTLPAAKQTQQPIRPAPATTIASKPVPVPKSTAIPKSLPAPITLPGVKSASQSTSTSSPKESASNDGTQQILNKLRACGVQVKRGSTQLNSEPLSDAGTGVKNRQTLEIMRKLQSKGIKCTKVNSH